MFARKGLGTRVFCTWRWQSYEQLLEGLLWPDSLLCHISFSKFLLWIFSLQPQPHRYTCLHMKLDVSLWYSRRLRVQFLSFILGLFELFLQKPTSLGIIWSQNLMSMRCCLDVSFFREVESSNPKYLAWKVWNFWNFFFRPQLIWNY